MNEEEYKIYSLATLIKQDGNCHHPISISCNYCDLKGYCSAKMNFEILKLAKIRLEVYPQHIIFEALL